MTVLLSGLSYGKSSRFARVPELGILRETQIGIYGVGAIGAFIAIEFARMGVKLVRLVDPDIVDPAGTCRWPLGVSFAGMKKVHALDRFISTNYPLTKVDPVLQGIGAAEMRPSAAISRSRPNEWEEMLNWNRDLDLVIDATAEFGVQQCLAYQLSELRIPLISVAASAGGWGGEVVRSCVLCYGFAVQDRTLPSPPKAANAAEIQPAGCGDRTFAAAGFDTAEIGMIGVRFAVATLCKRADGAYPDYDADALTIRIRDDNGTLIGPVVERHKVKPHASCPLHGTTTP
jgi:hypothetical protein